MFDEDGALQALTAQAQLNQPTAPQAPSTFQGSWSAVAKIVPAAVSETARAFNAISTPRQLSDAKRQHLNQEYGAGVGDREAVRNAGAIEAASDVDKTLSRQIKSFTPDPQTSGTAAQIIHGVGKTVTKAIAYTAAGGLPAVAVGLGSDEGINESLRLQDAGVDQVTANKAGVVRGLSTAVSTALPGVGPTLAKSVGLVAVAGPGAFMADQAAIKSILENANYADKAAEYDPFDVTNLLLSSVPGAVVAGLSLRGRAKATARAAESSPLDASEAVAKQEVAVDRDAAAVTAAADQEAAARVMQTDEHLQSKALTPHDDLVGQMNHQSAMELAARQLNDGAPLDVQTVVRPELAAGKFAEVPEMAPIARVTDEGIPVTNMQESVARIDENGSPAGTVVNSDVPPPRQSTDAVVNDVVNPAPEIDDAHIDQPIVVGTADDGTPITTTGRELLDDVRNQQLQADNDSKAFLAAVECFISSGDQV